MTFAKSTSPYDLNTLAVSLLEKRKQLDAIAIFRQTLAVLHTQLMDEVEQPKHSKENTQRSNSCLTYRLVDSKAESNSNMSSPHNCFELYAYGFTLEDTLHAVPNIEQEVICCVTLFHLGLSFHLLAVEKNSTKYFNDAYRFYGLARENFHAIHTFLVEVTGGHTTHPTPEEAQLVTDISLLLLTLINNMAHIQSHFSETAAVVQCIEELKYVLDFAKHSSLSEEQHVLLDSILVRVNCEASAPQAAAA
jgi:hypothetical protein